MIDADGDGLLSKVEYRKFLEAIGAWGRDNYTERDYDVKGWPKELSALGTTAERGLDLDAFLVLYTQYRMEYLQHDLKKFKAVRST